MNSIRTVGWNRPRALLLVGLGLAIAAAGCATVDATPRLKEAVELVERNIGTSPGWTAPWDAAPPPWDGSSVLTVDQAVTLALRNNRELRADIEWIGQANADLVQAGLLQNPVVNMMVMFPSGGGRSMLRGNGVPMQALQDLWLIPKRKEVAEARLQEAVLRVADRAVATAAEVKRLYARIQFTQRAIELTRDNITIVEQSTRLIQSRQIGGKATQVEVNLSRIRQLRLQSELLTLEAEYRRLKQELAMQMGFAGAGVSWSVDSVRELDDPLAEPPGESALLAASADQRFDFRAAGWSLAASGRDVELARREAWPDLAVGLTFERAPAPPSQNPSPAGLAGNAAARAAAGEAPMFRDPFAPKMREVEWAVGPMFEMEVPIFDQNQAQIAKAMHQYRQRIAEYQAVEQQIVQKVREARVMVEQSVQQIRLFRDAIVPEVDRNLKLVQQSYRGGTDQFTVYLQAQQDLIEVRLSALAFMRDAAVWRAELERQVGGRLPDATPVDPAGHPLDRDDADDKAVQEEKDVQP